MPRVKDDSGSYEAQEVARLAKRQKTGSDSKLSQSSSSTSTSQSSTSSSSTTTSTTSSTSPSIAPSGAAFSENQSGKGSGSGSTDSVKSSTTSTTSMASSSTLSSSITSTKSTSTSSATSSSTSKSTSTSTSTSSVSSTSSSSLSTSTKTTSSSQSASKPSPELQTPNSNTSNAGQSSNSSPAKGQGQAPPQQQPPQGQPAPALAPAPANANGGGFLESVGSSTAATQSSEAVIPIQNKSPVPGTTPAAANQGEAGNGAVPSVSSIVLDNTSFPQPTGTLVPTGTFIPTDIPGNPATTATALPTDAAAASTASGTATLGAVPQSAPATTRQTAIIAGSTAGGAIAIAIVAVLVFFWKRRQLNKGIPTRSTSELTNPKRRSPYGRFSARRMSSKIPAFPMPGPTHNRSVSIPESRSPPMAQTYGNIQSSPEPFRQRAMTSPNNSKPFLPPISQQTFEPLNAVAMTSTPIGVGLATSAVPAFSHARSASNTQPQPTHTRNGSSVAYGAATVPSHQQQHWRQPSQTASQTSSRPPPSSITRYGSRAESTYSDRSSGILLPTERTSSSIVSLPSAYQPHHVRSQSEALSPIPALPSAGPYAAWRDSMWSVVPTPVEVAPLTAGLRKAGGVPSTFGLEPPPSAAPSTGVPLGMAMGFPPLSDRNASISHHRYSKSSTSYGNPSADPQYASAERTVDSWIAAQRGTMYSAAAPNPYASQWGVNTRLGNLAAQVLTPEVPPIPQNYASKGRNGSVATTTTTTAGSATASSSGPPPTGVVGHAYHMRHAKNNVLAPEVTKKGHSRNASELSAFKAHPGERLL